jgi:hypothetical protein
MSTIVEKTREDYQNELAVLGGVLIDPAQSPPVKTPFVPCANLLLAQVRADAEMKAFYDQYFEPKYHKLFTLAELQGLLCNALEDLDDRFVRGVHSGLSCLPPSCVTLGGLRGSALYVVAPANRIARLFIGDLVWVFFMERLGLFRMFAKLVDDYATTGQYPVESANMTGLTLEVMVRQLKMGMASSVRDRAATYRRCLGWTTDVARGLSLATETSTAFDEQFHGFLQTALKYNADKRLAKAIQLTTTGASSAATRVSIKDTLVLLKESFAVFGYGRNYYNTLNAIVYAIATLDLVRNVRAQIGVPSTFNTANQYVSAAYYMLIEGKPAAESKPNRYLLHLSVANAARDLLLDIEKLDVDSVDAVGTWLDNEIVEERVEIYRKAYRDLTGIDLLESTARVEQRA